MHLTVVFVRGRHDRKHFWYFTFLFIYLFIFIVIQLQLYAFSPHPSTQQKKKSKQNITRDIEGILISYPFDFLLLCYP